MQNQTKLIATLAAATAAFVLSANAATTLIDEDWESPAIAITGGTQRVDAGANAGYYPAWSFPSTNTFNARSSGGGFPFTGSGRMLQFEWTGSNATYDTGHTWASTDSYSLDFNASEQSWNSAKDRWLVVEVTETISGDTLWSQYVEIPEYDSGSSSFTAAETFSYSFSASSFTAGAEGSTITFEVGQLADALTEAIDNTTATDDSLRGSAVDNILFEVTVVPEPSTTAILGLAGIALMFRRRK
jgi:hypothetical protein